MRAWTLYLVFDVPVWGERLREYLPLIIGISSLQWCSRAIENFNSMDTVYINRDVSLEGFSQSYRAHQQAEGFQKHKNATTCLKSLAASYREHPANKSAILFTYWKF